jgi:uncharacterized protein (DUF1501 family)
MMADQNNAFTRREFLYSGLAMVSTIGSVPTFLSDAGTSMADTSMRTSSKPGVPEDRVLVVVQLSGGNDGLNTVIPYGADAYYEARPSLGVNEKKVLTLDDDRGVGLHPALDPVHQMVNQNRAAVVQGVGYPNPNRSHFASMDVWHSGDTRGGQGEGWIGRALDEAQDPNNHGLEGVAINNETPMAMRGKTARPVTFQNPWTLQWFAGNDDDRLAKAYEELHGPEPERDPSEPASFIYRTACDAQVAADRVRKAATRDPKNKFPDNGLGRQLQRVAGMIAEELPTRVYYVAMGGFDTHADQGNQHKNLLEQFSSAMNAFQQELKDTGQSKRVITVAFSEFGRRVKENASNGTDHGTAGPMFLFGDHVRPGLLGEHPSLTDLQSNDLIHTVDFRSIYAALLDKWMKLDSRRALGKRFKPADVLKGKLENA